MGNLQDILNKVTNSELSKVGVYGALIRRKYESQKIVYVFDCDGNFIEEIYGLKACMEKYGYIRGSLIRNLIHPSKFYFSYINEFSPRERDYRKYTGKPILVFQNNILIGEFLSAVDCARELKLNNICISNCLLGKHKQHKGYTFKFK